MIEGAETTLREAAERRKAIARKWGVPAAADAAPAKGEDMLPDSELARIEALAKKAQLHLPPDHDVPTRATRDFYAAARDAVPKLVTALRSARREIKRIRSLPDFPFDVEAAGEDFAALSDELTKAEQRAEAAERERDALRAEGQRLIDKQYDEAVKIIESQHREGMSMARGERAWMERAIVAESERDALRAVLEAHACPPDARHHACVGCDLRAALDAAREGKG